MACAKIAVIAPERAVRDLYQGALDDKYDIFPITDGADILNTINAEAPNAILVDLRLTDVDTLKLVEELQHTEHDKDRLVIVVADFEVDKNLPDAFWEKHLNVDLFISPPLNPGRIRAMVDQAFIKRVKPRDTVGPGFL